MADAVPRICRLQGISLINGPIASAFRLHSVLRSVPEPVKPIDETPSPKAKPCVCGFASRLRGWMFGISNPCGHACNYCRLPTEDTHSSRGLQGLVFFVLLEISFSRCTSRSGRFRFRLGMRVNVYVVTKTFSITQCRPYNTAKV